MLSPQGVSSLKIRIARYAMSKSGARSAEMGQLETKNSCCARLDRHLDMLFSSPASDSFLSTFVASRSVTRLNLNGARADLILAGQEQTSARVCSVISMLIPSQLGQSADLSIISSGDTNLNALAFRRNPSGWATLGGCGFASWRAANFARILASR